MTKSIPAAVLLGAAIASGSPVALADPLVLEVQCLCKLGHKPDWYKGNVALTPESRDKMKALIEAGAFELWKQVTLKGKGCNPATFPANWKDKCGDTSISHTAADGKRTQSSVPNEEYTGEVTIEVKSTFGIPKSAQSDKNKVVTLDDKRWPSATTFGVMGIDVNASKPVKKKRSG